MSITTNRGLADNATQEHYISRSYDGNAQADAHAPEAIAAWPDFRVGDEGLAWKWNYLFSTSRLSGEVAMPAIVTTGISHFALRRSLADAGRIEGHDEEDYRKCLTNWSSERGPWEGTGGARDWFEWLRIHSGGEQDRRETCLQRCDAPFEAALFRLPVAGGSMYAGLGVLPPAGQVPIRAEVADGMAQIACDFGTSNTIVYYRQGRDRARQLPFSPRLRRFKGGRGDDRYNAFMPAGTINQPFATVMQLRSGDWTAAAAQQAWDAAGKPALWRDYAFFDPDVLSMTETLLSGRGHANLVFDIKWCTHPDERARIRRYLRHIAILSLAEVIGSREAAPETVEWHFSYPISMPDAGNYQTVVSGALEDWSAPGGGKFTTRFHTESDAALNYFAGVETARTTAVFVLDIGGGSTDVALATEHQGLIWQQSVRLAGDDFMTEFLLHNRKFLEVLELAGTNNGVFGDTQRAEIAS